MSASRVVVVGSMNRDYVCRVDSLPRPGETLLGGELSLGAGGKGGNQAVAAARLGAPCAMVGAVGDDADGRHLVAALSGAGVDVAQVAVRADVATGAAFVFVDPAGENSIVVAPGANSTLTAASITPVLERTLTASDVLVVQAEIPLDAVVAAIRAADAVGARAVLNLAPFQQLPADVIALCDPLVVNESEAKSLLGWSDADSGDGEALVAGLTDCARSVVVTLGAAGAVLSTAGRVDQLVASAVDVVDSTGAGDAFTGALAAALAVGSDLVSAVRRGVAAGTYSVQRPGAQASYPGTDDLFA